MAYKRKTHRKTKRKTRRSAAQKAATKRMLAARKRSLMTLRRKRR